ncbi:class I SAM-dependent methyltransferase [Cytophagaceae bacterium YF14B1]|uniref:Class I SAM-dependent methyltransferase n=1 Tax=Xanthocytophaga flava TaxID=3048013 RepID=A0AAE3QT66_9BACT|nr:class I SAM-dependent methyltransferase [Xanthocytophaga flavus]MDJ1482394.1 class I SAM-dependent methyltransferase [Xanthocytophaga flavus]
MISPITGTTNTVLEEKISTQSIIEGYKAVFNIDVSPYFKGFSMLEVYKCQDTGYRYYYPFSFAGDGTFYDYLQKIPWYYQDWKWEYQAVLDILTENNYKVLEIGCGKGAFIKQLQHKGHSCIGLELSADATILGQKEGLDIRNQTTEDFALTNTDSFDIVCSFQLLEHISNVNSLITSSLKTLKKGGKLIIAVPNNDILFFSYTKQYISNLNHLYQPIKLLNLPPHHMGLWTPKSISSLTTIYNLKLDTILKEPINEHRKSLIISILIEKLGLAGKFINKLAQHQKEWILQKLFPSYFINADTMIAIFTKL